ncbi:sigma-54-dependent transcriptional regulator [Grimontia marina]|uniref:C4-dicarboxylate transport transcriptional regulatory protein DctD n=1 Tax=Grimontia marina TaxID=646534 RepID=A0A128FHC7_9GAMM|nr:sigma-54 dependent transcriptional regulator [Grimontia marina]CZF86208.1 C4-dicarboxylate transport transcriptional regulatory protein DctD [Grimontia marina]
MTPEIWIIDDERTIRDSLSQTLDIEGFHSRAFSNAKDALENLNATFEGVIVSDINMPQMDGMTFLSKALDVDPELSIVMLTGHGDISTAVSAMRQGAYDFLEKPFSTDTLLDVIKRGTDKRQLVMENRELKRQLETQSAPGPRILGNADSVKQLRRTIFYLKDQNGDMLLQGERGTGKELAARFIHDQGTRQDEPFVALKCRQVPEALIAMELFGSEQQAYASFPSYKNSKVAAAGKGTLFLDGIEALSLNVQEKLATLTGSSERPRIIASTRQDLTNSVTQGHFSARLFQNLAETTLIFPPLRDRREDIVTLCQNFVRTTASRFGIAPPKLELEHKEKLLKHPWKGNVRELQAFAERWVLMGEQNLTTENGESNEKEHDSLAERILKVERAILFDALNRHNGMLKEVQIELGLARKTLYAKLKKHHLDKQNFKG